MELAVVLDMLVKGFLVGLFQEPLCVEMKPVVVEVVVEPIEEQLLFNLGFVFLVEIVEIPQTMTHMLSKNRF
jgi:hypothetical protein